MNSLKALSVHLILVPLNVKPRKLAFKTATTILVAQYGAACLKVCSGIDTPARQLYCLLIRSPQIGI